MDLMLTHVLLAQFATSTGRVWLEAQSPHTPREWRVDFNGDLHLRFSEGSAVWSPGRVVKLLQQSSPELAVPLLWEINRQYDDREETSQYLRQLVQEKCKCVLEPVPFYRHRSGLVLTCEVKQGFRPVEGIQAKVEDGQRLVLHLNPVDWVRDALVELIKERAL